MRFGGYVLASLACCLAISCGQTSEADEPAKPVATRDPAATFAPLVMLDRREPTYPISADYFLKNSGLEWAGGPCPFEQDVANGLRSDKLSGAGSGAPSLPPLTAVRLGGKRPYSFKPWTRRCLDTLETDRPTFTTDQRTRPYDLEDRPNGLYVDEGFNLDILTDYQPGPKRVARVDSIEGVPAYYAEERMTSGGKRMLRLSYWLLFGRGEAKDPKTGKPVPHEGDWERIDVLLRRGQKAASFFPVNVRYRIDGDFKTVAWVGADRRGSGSTHPVAFLVRAAHTPYPHASTTDKRVAWRTWDRLRSVRREPWFGYGGGWGAFGFTAAESGPLGPSPFELESAIGMSPKDL
jgi:hypothetical protein